MDTELREKHNFENISKTKKQYDRKFKAIAVELSKSRSDLSVLSKEVKSAGFCCTADSMNVRRR